MFPEIPGTKMSQKKNNNNALWFWVWGHHYKDPCPRPTMSGSLWLLQISLVKAFTPECVIGIDVLFM